MSESKEVFVGRIKERHIQLEEMKKFYELCHRGMAILGVTEEEQMDLINSLENDNVEHSNDMVIEMILDFVMKISKEEKLLQILRKIRVANIEDNSIVGRSYPKYFDNSYYIEIGRKMERQIRLLSDVFAVFFMYNEEPTFLEKIILKELLKANLQRFKEDKEHNHDYGEVQLHMMYCDKFMEHGFTDKYIAYAREIHEVALAFFIGHEVGHHYLGHTDPENTVQDDNKIKELKADCYGIDFAFQYLKSAYSNEEESYGIHQLAAVYIPMVVSAYFCDNIFDEGNTHPSVIKRLLGVQLKLKRILDNKGFNEVQKYIANLYETIEFPITSC